MPRVAIGMDCPEGHFNAFGHLWMPIRDSDLDKLAERSATPLTCEDCGSVIDSLPHAEGQEREADRLARVGGRNVHAGLQSRPKTRPPEGPLTPAEWKRRVFDRQRERPAGPALCAVTGEPLSFAIDDAHHVTPKSLLRECGLYHLIWDERNGLAVKRFVHSGHTSCMRPIPRSALLPCNLEFARELGPWALARIESSYPK